MKRQIYVNLPVKNLKKSMEFFSKLGFDFDLNFTNEDGACMIIGEDIYAMLLVEKFFKTFISKEICDTQKATEVLICISEESRAGVDDLIAKALKAGGASTRPAMDYGFMYQRSFEDLDGHIWEVIHMDESQNPSKVNAG